jgi:hypothetical protein
MQTVFGRYPWLTQTDARVFSLAWRLGLEWGVCRLDREDSKLTLLVPANSTSLWWVTEEAARREKSLHKFLTSNPNQSAGVE